jgi:hypothetical protein
MKRLISIAFIATISLSAPTIALADDWPKLSGDTRPEQCAAALRIAKATFQSDSFQVYFSPVIPRDIGSVLVLGPKQHDISGGDALEADNATFDKLPDGRDSSPRSFYWGTSANYGYRLVVAETPYGWRDAAYSVFIADKNMTSREFIAKVTDNDSNIKPIPAIQDSLRPPLIFRDKNSGRPWIIDVGQEYEILGDWRVYGVEPEGAKLQCTVQFRPNIQKAADLLPQAVRDLASTLDTTIGPGRNEGTLQPTVSLRLRVNLTWANTALRPWALFEPYNTRKEVDAGLKDWSHNGPKYVKIYKEIQRQYPLAEQALAAYYENNFQRSASDAKIFAAYALDIAIRSHYVFHSDDPDHNERYDQVQKSPWRNK